MEGDLLYNPLIEFGDMARTYDRKENVYITPITYVASGLNGATTVKTQAESPIRGSSTYNSDALKTLIQAKKLVEVEINARELAVGKLEEAMKNENAKRNLADTAEQVYRLWRAGTGWVSVF